MRLLTNAAKSANVIKNKILHLQGRVRFPTGGTAHEPQGMIRCNSEADSTVWMEEDF